MPHKRGSLSNRKRLEVDRKEFANDLKTTPSEQAGKKCWMRSRKKWKEKQLHAMKRWYDNRDAVSLIFKLSKDLRRVSCT